ncbi:unnamed protein product [Mytilus edulis]|uniref:Reverse transcriptase domain-containing protein n=1 Tax=Mytilus edulis TaxID=6550 RepID=A0A8S3QVR2_MYTED|nr:unnamed protein product [Mytilus edulis]
MDHFRNESTFTSKTGRDEYLDSFIDTISKLPINYHNTKQNLSRREKKSLEELKNNPSIILKEADKGGGIVIMDKTFYREKVLEQLNDNEYYTKLRKNNDKSTIRKIKKLVEEYSESFTDNEIAYLCDFTPKEANFYGLPKIHKSNTIQTAVKHQNRKYIESPNPSDLKLRPIVAGPESPTQRMSHFLDLILKKLCPLIPSYVRDDIDFLRYIPETVPKNTLLTTFDVTSLYTNIPHYLGTTAIKYWVEINREIVDGRFDTEFIVKALKIILEGNIFYFDGFKFTPTPTPNTTTLKSDIQQFSRRLRLREYFGNGKFDDGSLVRNKSTFTPKTGRDEYLDSFIDTISKLPINYHNTKQNLSRREKKSLEELKNNPSIILKEADKGGGIVIMDKTFYREKVLEQLNDNEYYTKLRKNNDKSTIRKIKKLVEEYSESFTDNEIAYLCDFTPKEANFYGLPKIHKSNTIQTAVKHQNRKYIESPNPNDLKLRPIVAGPESTTQRMSHFLDLILKKLCPLIPSYVRDDIDFLRYIPETVPKNTLLTTFDVTSLYTNIPHDLGTTAIKYWVEINREIVDGRFDTELIDQSYFVIRTKVKPIATMANAEQNVSVNNVFDAEDIEEENVDDKSISSAQDNDEITATSHNTIMESTPNATFDNPVHRQQVLLRPLLLILVCILVTAVLTYFATKHICSENRNSQTECSTACGYGGTIYSQACFKESCAGDADKINMRFKRTGLFYSYYISDDDKTISNVKTAETFNRSFRLRITYRGTISDSTVDVNELIYYEVNYTYTVRYAVDDVFKILQVGIAECSRVYLHLTALFQRDHGWYWSIAFDKFLEKT